MNITEAMYRTDEIVVNGNDNNPTVTLLTYINDKHLISAFNLRLPNGECVGFYWNRTTKRVSQSDDVLNLEPNEVESAFAGNQYFDSPTTQEHFEIIKLAKKLKH